jgi:tetratricopeptide (TPR) repeat protein
LNISFSHDAVDPPSTKAEPDRRTPRRPDLAALQETAERQKSARSYRDLADATILWGGTAQVDAAIKAYENSLQQQADDAAALFRLGVAFRLRYDSSLRQPDDFANAVNRWEQALTLNPNQYIWRRRIQQYGPRLDKPYSFYDWVEQARTDISARSETPLPLAVEPQGAELAQPARVFGVDSAEPASPDPDGRILRDTKSLIVAEVTRVPSTVRPGSSGRIHIAFSPNVALPGQWNNEAEPLQVWIEQPEGWLISQRWHAVAPTSNQATSREVRRIDFEVQVPPDATGTVKIPAYALYYVCEDADGACQYLRQDLEIEVVILD